MTQSYDLILTGATVVNHDGAAVRDLAVADGRIAAIGDLSGWRPARPSTAAASPCFQA